MRLGVSERQAVRAAEVHAGRYRMRLSSLLWRLYGPERWLYATEPYERALLSHGVFSTYRGLCALGLRDEAEERIGRAQGALLERGGSL